MASDGDKVAAAILATGFANRYKNDNCGSAIYVRAYWEVLAQIEKGPPKRTAASAMTEYPEDAAKKHVEKVQAELAEMKSPKAPAKSPAKAKTAKAPTKGK